MAEMKPRIEIESGLPGPPQSVAQTRLELVPFLRGLRGLPGFSTTVVAQEALGGHRTVTVDGFHAGPEDADRLAGVSIAAGVIGATVDVTVKGMIEESSWSWTPEQPIFIGPGGVLTQSPSTTGPIRRIAWALSATAINVDIMPPVLQA
jgi:hypothetical protein